MITRSIAKDEWTHYFDELSKRLQSERVELDVLSLDLGDQIEEDFVALNGLSYDPKDDMIYVFTYPLRHFIAHPEQVWIVEEDERLQSIEIEAMGGTKHLIVLRDAERAGEGPRQDPTMSFNDLESIP